MAVEVKAGETYSAAGTKNGDGWGMFKVKICQNAPKWDGHTPDDVTRLLSL